MVKTPLVIGLPLMKSSSEPYLAEGLTTIRKVRKARQWLSALTILLSVNTLLYHTFVICQVDDVNCLSVIATVCDTVSIGL